MYEIFKDEYHLAETQIEKTEFDNPEGFQYNYKTETGNEKQQQVVKILA